jgi:hypothetical protein
VKDGERTAGEGRSLEFNIDTRRWNKSEMELKTLMSAVRDLSEKYGVLWPYHADCVDPNQLHRALDVAGLAVVWRRPSSRRDLVTEQSI